MDPNPCNWCIYKRRKLVHTYTHGRHLRTLGDRWLSTNQGERPQREPGLPHLDLGPQPACPWRHRLMADQPHLCAVTAAVTGISLSLSLMHCVPTAASPAPGMSCRLRASATKDRLWGQILRGGHIVPTKSPGVGLDPTFRLNKNRGS